MLCYQFLIDHFPQVFVRELFDLVDFMGRPEAIKEVHEWNSRLQRNGLCDHGVVHHFLDAVRYQHSPTGLANGHHILMVSKDR